MKKVILGIALLCGVGLMNGQVAGYSFTQLSGSYNEIPVTGGTSTAIAIGFQDDNSYANIPIGFNFLYNNTTYTSFGVNVNGWIMLGTTSPASSYNPLSSGSSNNVISGFGRDLMLGAYKTATTTSGSNTVVLGNINVASQFSVGDTLFGTGIPANTTITAISGNSLVISANATAAGTSVGVRGSISYQLSGSAPNRVLTVQWRRAGRFSNTSGGLNDFYNYQIKLYETTNVVEIVYGNFGTNSTTTTTGQVGLRGNSNTDFNNRSVLSTGSWAASTTGTVNTASAFLSSSVAPTPGQVYRWTPPAGCSGTPASNAAVASASAACPTGTVLLSLATTYTVPGFAYQWLSSTTGSNTGFSAISNATAAAYTASNITTPTWFQAVITCTNSAQSTTSTPVQIGTINDPCICASYCASSASSTSDEELFNVSIGTLNNTSNCSQTGGPGSILNRYSNYTAILAAPSLTLGNTYTLSVTAGQCGSGQYQGIVLAYIDFNQNGSFTDAGETVFTSTYGIIPIAGITFTAPVTIPSGATPGNTRMRVIVIESNSGSPCGTYSWGETEDYCVYLDPGPPCTAASGGTVSSLSLCAGSTGTLNSTGYSTGFGISYQWAVSSTQGGPYTPVTGTGSNTPTYALGAQNTPTVLYYVLTATCSSASLTGSSNEATLTVNPNPVIGASPSSATICVPGSPSVNITASGAATYTWAPAAGLSSTVGANVDALPASTTVYTIAGTSSVNCTSTTTMMISVNNGVSMNMVSASPSVICSGNNATLSAMASQTMGNICQPVYTSGSGFGDYVESVNLNTLVNNMSGPLAAPYYTLYPQSFATTTLNAGATYTLLVTAGTYGGQTLAGWIDFNQNGSLLDTGEKLGEATGIAAGATGTIVFTVPANAANGTQRLRIRGVWITTNVDPCLTYSYGETEDYIVTIAGGTDALTYSWTPSTFLSSTNTPTTIAQNANASMVYSVTATAANGCLASDIVALTVNPLPSVTVNSGTICSGNSFTIMPTGAQTYTYLPAGPVVSPVVNQTYTVTGEDANGCVSAAVISTVDVNPSPTITATAANYTICEGGSTALNASGATTYTWSNAATGSVIAVTPSVTTTYTVDGEASGCVGSATVQVNVNALPGVTLTAASSTVCTNGPTVALTGSPMGGVYTGSNVSNGVFTPGANAGTFTPGYSYTDASTGCSNSASVSIIVSNCTGLENTRTQLAGLNVYPNPNTGAFTVELNNGMEKTIVVSDLTGRIIYSENSNNNLTRIDLSAFANGVYFVRISSNSSVETVRVIKQ